MLSLIRLNPKQIATGGIFCAAALVAAPSHADITLFEGDGTFFSGAPAGFTFGGFAGGSVTESATSLTIDASEFGGVGRDLAITNFEASDAQLRLVYRILDGNVATNFRVILRDNDGDDSAPGLGTEDYQFFVDTSFATPLNDGSGFSEQFVSLTEFGNPVFRAKAFGFTYDGDGVQNYGLDQFQIQSAFGETDRLFIELQSVEIQVVPEPASLALASLGGVLMLARRRCGS